MPLGSFLAGLADSYNPCSIGVLLVSLSILIGLRKPHLIATFGVSYLTAIFVTYFLIGLGILRAFHLFGIHGFFGYVAGFVLVGVGLIHLFPQLFPRARITQWLRSCRMPLGWQQYFERNVIVAGAIIGFLIGLCTIPCAGGIYLGTIGLLALKTTFWQGVFNLFIFNIGFILPLAIVFVLASRPKVLAIIERGTLRLQWVGTIVTSLIMIGIGIGMLILLGGFW